MAHTITDKRQLVARVRRIKGQADALERALDGEADCMDVLQQIAAVRGAVTGLMNKVLEGHIRGHLGDPALTPERREAEVEAVVKALQSYLR